jgi:hypothetical protein
MARNDGNITRSAQEAGLTKVRVRFAYEFIQVLETITVIGGI